MSNSESSGRARVFVDLEYCYPNMQKGDARPTERDIRQVVQIAAVLYDTDKNKEIASFDVLSKPAFEKRVTPFFEELTGITGEQIDKTGIRFPEALSLFVQFCSNYPVWTFDKDWYVLKQNCDYFDMPFPFENQPFARVKARLASWGLDKNKYSSGTLHKSAGIEMSGHVHNALHDVRSMAAAVSYFEKD